MSRVNRLKESIRHAEHTLEQLAEELEKAEVEEMEAKRIKREASNKRRIMRGDLVFAEGFASVGYRATYINIDGQQYLCLIKNNLDDFRSLTEPVPTPDNQTFISRGQLRTAKPRLKLTFEE